MGPAATPEGSAALVLATLNPKSRPSVSLPVAHQTQKRHRGLIRSTKEVGVVEQACKSSTPKERQEKHKFKVIPRNI